jgi:hypothetical protein
MNDKQIGGTHYIEMAIQPWEAMAAWTTREQFVGFLLCSATAYLARFNTEDVQGKGGLVDVKKAAHCLEHLIELLESSEADDAGA